MYSSTVIFLDFDPFQLLDDTFPSNAKELNVVIVEGRV